MHAGRWLSYIRSELAFHNAGRDSVRPDYHMYRCTPKETARILLIYLALVFVISFFFYNSLWAVFIFLPPGYLFLQYQVKEKGAGRRKKLLYDFREALNSLAVSLRAGYSVENAFREAAGDLSSTAGEDSDITREWQYMAGRIRLSEPVEPLICDFAARSGVEDIENFAAVFSAAKRMGGNIGAIVRDAAESIQSRIEVEREIEASLASKRFEQRIMTAMPAGIIVYMRLGSPGFLDIMYTTLLGRLIMTVCLILYGAAVWWSRKIVTIEV